MGEVLLGNLAGPPVFGNTRGVTPRLHSLAPWFAWSAVAAKAVGGFIAAYRTFSVAAALRVGLWGELLRGAITFVTIVSVVLLFHDAMPKDPSNLREFALGGHRTASEAELSRFIYSDGFAGTVNHVWLEPLLGLRYAEWALYSRYYCGPALPCLAAFER